MWRVEATDSAGCLLTLRMQVHFEGDPSQLRDHLFHRLNHSASLVHQRPGYDTMIQQFR